MNNDLISRSALKKALKSNCDVCNDKNTNWCEHCCPQNDFEDLIDNAPTVDYSRPSIEEIIGNMTDEELEYTTEVTVTTPKGKVVKFYPERPQGEWKFVFDDKVNNRFIYKCSECGREVSVYSSDALIPVYPFCHCGADMRKGGAE